MSILLGLAGEGKCQQTLPLFATGSDRADFLGWLRRRSFTCLALALTCHSSYVLRFTAN